MSRPAGDARLEECGRINAGSSDTVARQTTAFIDSPRQSTSRPAYCAELVEIGWDPEICLELVRTLLFNEVPRRDPAVLVGLFGVDTGRHYVAFRARPATGQSLEGLSHELSGRDGVRLSSGLVAGIGGELVGFVDSPPKQVRSGTVGVGAPRLPDRLAESFTQATRAVETAQVLGRRGVHSIDGLGLLPTILADTNVGHVLQRRYLVRDNEDPLPPEVLSTVWTYFAHGMNVERVAAEMVLHQNTVRNRIARFEELTHASLRDPAVAMEVWWALRRTEMIGLPHQVGSLMPTPPGRTGHPAAASRRLPAGHPVHPVTRPDATQRAEFLRGLLRGTLTPADLDRRQLLAYGVDADREYRAVRARPMPGHTMNELARALGFVFGQASGGGLGAVVHGDLVGFLAEPPAGSVPGLAGIGPAGPLRWLSESFRMASRALDIAENRGLPGSCRFEQVSIIAALFADEAVGDALCSRYLDPLGANEFADEVIDTLQVYLLTGGRHIGRTAQRLFVHPNTVRYRIGRFEELTGVSLRSTPAIFEVLGALEYRSARSAPARRRAVAA